MLGTNGCLTSGKRVVFIPTSDALVRLGPDVTGRVYYWTGDECFTTDNKLIITTDKKHLRPAEVDVLQGDASKAKRVLGWEHKHNVESLMKEMVDADFDRIGADIEMNLWDSPERCL